MAFNFSRDEKAAIVGFTMSLAQEVARYDILVNCVVPGMMEVGVSANLTAKQRAEVLASDKASYITGSH